MAEFERLKSEAKELYNSGKYAECRKKYLLALESSPNIAVEHAATCWSNISQSYLQEREYASAVKAAKNALGLDPSNEKAYIRRSVAYEHLERFHKSLSDMVRVQELCSSRAPQGFISSSIRRIKKNIARDAEAAAREANECGTLVHDNQTIRINFRDPLPNSMELDSWFQVGIFASNEFGLFKSSAFPDKKGVALSVNIFPESLKKNLRLQTSEMPVILQPNGKAMFEFRIAQGEGSLPNTFQLRVQLGNEWEKKWDVMSVLSMPIEILLSSKNIGNEGEGNCLGVHCQRPIKLDGLPHEILLQESPGLLGIGGKIWDSSEILAQYLINNKDKLHGKHVVELGSGVGLVGITCAMLGAASTTLTDMQEVIPLLKSNIKCNNSYIDSKIEAKSYLWGSSSELLRNSFDVLLMSDVVYDPTGYDPLIKALLDLSFKESLILMAHRSRNPKDPIFFKNAKAYFELIPLARDSIGRLSGVSADVCLWQFKSGWADRALWTLKVFLIRGVMAHHPHNVLGVETEDAAELSLGDDFRNETCLSNAEVAVILEKQKSDYESQEKGLTPVFQKTHAYVQRFSGTKDPVANQASVTELREALMTLTFKRDEGEIRLEEFEIACVSNLNPEEVEEATSLIPSLQSRFEENEIEEILAIVSRTTARMFS